MKSREPEYRANYFKKWYAEHRPLRPRICITCGISFLPSQGGQMRCDACRMATCPQCKENFITSVRGRKYCSRKCLALAHIDTLLSHRGIKPRTYHLNHRDKHGCAADREWRVAVFERDGYRCRECGASGGRLQAHHIQPYKANPILRYELSNGLTLCVACHQLTDSYGWQNYWASQIAAKRCSQEVMDFSLTGEGR